MIPRSLLALRRRPDLSLGTRRRARRRSLVLDMLGLLTLDGRSSDPGSATPASLAPGRLPAAARLRGEGLPPRRRSDDPHPYEAALAWLAGWDRLLASGRRDCLRARRVGASIPRVADGGVGRHPGRLPGSEHSSRWSTWPLLLPLGRRVSAAQLWGARGRLGRAASMARLDVVFTWRGDGAGDAPGGHGSAPTARCAARGWRSRPRQEVRSAARADGAHAGGGARVASSTPSPARSPPAAS